MKRKIFTSRSQTVILLLILVTLLGIFLTLKFINGSFLKADQPISIVSGEAQTTDLQETKPSVSTPSVSTEDQQKALSLYDQGLKLYYDRQFSSALALFNEALALDPNCYQALNGKGATYAFQGRYEEGITLIKQALGLKPDFVYAHFNLGLAHELASHWTEAIESYQEALQLDSKDVWSYYGIASIYGRQGNLSKVIEYLEPAIALNPDVREVAQEEKDFDPVKNDLQFQALLKSPPTKITPEKISSEASQEKMTQVPILYYHSIMDEPGNELRMPPEEFEEQMKYLSQNGYQVITLDQLYNALYNKGSLPAKPIAITFDDGYRDNFTNAFPIMQEYNFPGTAFMVSSYIDGEGFLTTDQLKQLEAAGWTIGGHTVNHTDLSLVSVEDVKEELKNSRNHLESLLGHPLKYIAYPYGAYNSTVMNLTQDDGYLAGFTTVRGWANPESDRYALKRIYCYANMGIPELERRITNPEY